MKRSRANAGFLTHRGFKWSRRQEPEDRRPKPERRPKAEGRKQQPPHGYSSRMPHCAVTWEPFPPKVLCSKTGEWPLRVSDFSRRSRAHWECPGIGLALRSLLLLLVCSLVCFGQRQNEPRPAPLDPVQAEREARALVANMLAQKPEQNTTNTGRVRIRDAAGKEREIPVRFEIAATPTNWVSVYEILTSERGPAGMRLTVIHSGQQPNRYQLIDPAKSGVTNGVPRELAPDETMIPFAGSDFWIADLGLEFLHWPRQRLLERNAISHHKACRKLESVYPTPVPGGYARVVSWIMIEQPHGVVHADAYDAQGKVLKRFDPTALEKVQGDYQLEEMEMRNTQTGSHTWIKFNLSDRAAVESGRLGRGQGE